jgi:DNA-directed RNA polymerase subunit N (RpoN/RPB10)
MLTPIVCFDCGLPVGDKEDLFRHMRAERVKKVLAEHGTTAAHALTDAGLQIDCSEIMAALGVHMDCCRKTLATALIYTDIH